MLFILNGEIITQIIIAVISLISVYVFQNKKLRNFLTDLIMDLFRSKHINLNNHLVSDTLIELKFKTQHTIFDNAIKTELYQYYTLETLILMEKLVKLIYDNQSLKLNKLKIFIKTNLYTELNILNDKMETFVKLPEDLHAQFEKFKNYLIKQHTYSIDNALGSNQKKMLLVKVLDAIENNSMWFLFYTNEMFERFNGHFDNVNRADVLLF